MKDANKILIVGLAAYFLFMRQSQASDNGGAGGGSNGGAGGGAGGGSNGGGLPNGFPDLPNVGGTTSPPFSPSRTVITADGRTVGVVEMECPGPNNPFVGTYIDQQSGREVGVCAGDPRINNDPTYQAYETPLQLVLG